MANANSNMTTNLYSDQVLKGFVDYLAPLRIFSLDASPSPVEKGQAVVVPFIISGSTPASWAESTGYAVQTNTRTGKTCTMSSHYFVFSGLTDIEAANSSITSLEQVAYNQGASLASTVFTSIATNFTSSNFSSTTNIVSSSLMTVDKLIDIRKTVADLKWPEGNRNVILNSNAFRYLLKDDDLKYIYRGEANTVQTAQIKNVFGWSGVWENNLLPSTDAALELVGVAVNPDALIVANRYLKPQDNNILIEAYPVSDPASGLTLGYRRWYDAQYGRMVSVYECVWGATVGNSAAASLITADIDV